MNESWRMDSWASWESWQPKQEFVLPRSKATLSKICLRAVNKLHSLYALIPSLHAVILVQCHIVTHIFLHCLLFTLISNIHTVFIHVIGLYWKTKTTSTCTTRSSATATSTARTSCTVFYDISREKICWWLINHFT